MTPKHPERRPVDQVEGVICVDDLAGHQLTVTADTPDALYPLIRVLAEAAERAIHQRNEQPTHEEGAA